jgi:DNA-binding transcriptional regulator GbsR (MarR family)
MSQVQLLAGQSKKIEREIVAFYKTVGEIIDLNPRRTEIFAYLKIYDALTQEQLKELTGFSLGTISTTLQLFLQTEIVSRQFVPGTHKNIYMMKPEKVEFVYTPASMIIDDFERLDSYIVDKQTELQELQQKYPIEAKILYLRLNGLRNYIEAQRRQINRKKKYPFFQEDVSEILAPNEMVVYPFETREIEETIMDVFEYYRNDPVRNRILSILYTHRSATQQTLMDYSGFSRSAVSRFLHQSLNVGYIHALPREHHRPRIYYLESISLSILIHIMNTDRFIFSSIPRFQEILSTLQSRGPSDRDTTFLIMKVKDIIEQIENFKRNTRFLRQAHRDLSKFLEKDIN